MARTTSAKPTHHDTKDNPYDDLKSKIDAIARIRADLMRDGREPKPAEIYEVYRTTKHSSGDKTKDMNAINSNLVTVRKREPGPAGRKLQAGSPPAPSGPTVEDLLKVKELADQYEGINKMASMVSEVERLAAQVGGLDKLKACLDALNKLLGER